jgi:hypothetical protein
MFTQDNTTGYTQKELDSLNAELATRLAMLPKDASWETIQEVEKAFHDEVSKRG